MKKLALIVVMILLTVTSTVPVFGADGEIPGKGGYIIGETQEGIFINSGTPDNSFTGIAKNIYSGQWEYVKNGKANRNFTGIAVSNYDGLNYFVRGGTVDFSFTGVGKNPATGRWEYVRNGKAYLNYTGIATSSYDGKNYFVRDGVCDFTFTGFAYNPVNKTWDYVKNGKADYTFQGAAKSVKDGEYYYGNFGVVDFTYTGLAYSKDHGTYIYFHRGRYMPTYQGVAKSTKTNLYYHVWKGKWANYYTGQYKNTENKKITYTVTRGRVINSYVKYNGKTIKINEKSEYNRDNIPEAMQYNWVTRYMNSVGFKWDDYLESEYAFNTPTTINNYTLFKQFTPAIPYSGYYGLWMGQGMDIDKWGGDKGSYKATLNSVQGFQCAGFANFAYTIYWKYGEGGKYKAAAAAYRKILAAEENNGAYRNLENVMSFIVSVDGIQKQKIGKGYIIAAGKTIDDYPLEIGDAIGFKSNNDFKWPMNEHVAIYLGKLNGKHWIAHTSNDYARISVGSIETYNYEPSVIIHFY